MLRHERIYSSKDDAPSEPSCQLFASRNALLRTFFSGIATIIVSISKPTVASSLGSDLIGISWALLAYQLSNIGLSMIFGRLSDLWSREKVFALGFFVFSVSSLLCALSLNVLRLILSRVQYHVSRGCCFERGAVATSVERDNGR
jgi:MFS family permease